MEKTTQKSIIKTFLSVVIMNFVLIVGIICLIGLKNSITSFVENQKAFNKAYSLATIHIANSTVDNSEIAQITIDHLEKLQQIQKNASTNDVMSFIYSTLSTILVALCAGCVAKSYNNVEKSKEAVIEAKKNADLSYDYSDKAKKSAKNINDTFKEMSKLLTKSNKLYDETSLEAKKQSEMIHIFSIQIEIIQARAALISHDKISANQRFFNIKNMIERVQKAEQKEKIRQLQLELLSLQTVVDSFQEYAETEEDKEPQKQSLLTAVARYRSSLNYAVDYCETLLQ